MPIGSKASKKLWHPIFNVKKVMETKTPVQIIETTIGNWEVEVAAGEVWMTRSEIARVFGVFVAAVDANIRAIYRSGSLSEYRTHREMKHVDLYNLEMIAALAFRLRSPQSEAFRRWLLRRPQFPTIVVRIAGQKYPGVN